ncbi:hypothetical protein NC651_038757 [Populus alba x Populus x berolinensis]|nr:hypothetical protein NC651_038757 [Populus alba x Populus x berolinensis]
MSTCAPKKKNRYTARSSTDSLGQHNRKRVNDTCPPDVSKQHAVKDRLAGKGTVSLYGHKIVRSKLPVMQEGSGKRTPMRILSGQKLHHASAELGSINRLDSVPLHMSLTCTAVQAKQKKTKPDPRKRVDFDSYHFVCSAILLNPSHLRDVVAIIGGFSDFF